jgi:hypothetical protein
MEQNPDEPLTTPTDDAAVPAAPEVPPAPVAVKKSPKEVLTAMQGTAEGYGQGLTTYPASTDPDQMGLHAECLELEVAGGVRRHLEHDGPTHPSGLPFIIWMPVAGYVPPAP